MVAPAAAVDGWRCFASVRMDWTDDELIERWHERAAILEYLGGRKRKDAERVAAIWIRRVFGRLPEAIKRELETK